MVKFKGWDKGDVSLGSGKTGPGIFPVIISASRSTDIPAFFSKWFINRLHAGYMKWSNPFNAKQVQFISFKKTRLFVFWTKNPAPLIPYLPEIDDSLKNYYFQFTLNNYEPEQLEPNVPPLAKRIETFQKLSTLLGKERVIWRYDPLILSDKLTIDDHIERISLIAEQLSTFTNKLVFSFADIQSYRKVKNNLSKVIKYKEFTPSLMHEFGEKLSKLNTRFGFTTATCGETIDLDEYGIQHNRCIDDELMVKIFKQDSELLKFLGYKKTLFGENWAYFKDKGQRKECGCIVSKDIGMYNTCSHYCSYCYANNSKKAVKNNLKRHHPNMEFLVNRSLDL